MKQLLILSGKGGTGKTTIAGAFIKLSRAKAYADCDVDAPNLHLVMSQIREPIKKDYYGLPKAFINTELCINCDKCRENCRFDAISADTKYKVDTFACEGCGVCESICPSGAIYMKPETAGELILYNESEKVFSAAQLKMGSGTSGLLVTEVKKQMMSNINNMDLAIIDGSPGIGCPVIASLSGVDMVLIVAEPSISGVSDMVRIIKTAEIFLTRTAVCVNKYDANPIITNEIKNYCSSKMIPFVGVVPFDSNALKAINKGITIVDMECISGKAVKVVYNKTMELLYK